MVRIPLENPTKLYTMSNPDDKIQFYEGAILQELLANSKKLAVLEEVTLKELHPEIKKISDIQADVNGLHQIYEDLQNSVIGVEKSLPELVYLTKSLEEKVYGVESTLLGLEGKLPGLEGELASLKGDVTGLNTKVETLQNTVNTLNSELSFIKKLAVTILVGIIINIFSQPVLNFVF